MGTHIQYSDSNYSSKDIARYLNEQSGCMSVTKIFPTLQGEGPLAGVPVVFVRTSGCNRGDKESPAGCNFCDTKFNLHGSKVMTFSDIIEGVNEAHRKVCDPAWITHIRKWIVLSGGEPMIQPNVAGFVRFAIDNGWGVQIESNGDFLPEDFPDNQYTMLVISPKMGNGQRTYSKMKQTVFNRADCLKYVISADPESPYHLPDLRLIEDWVRNGPRYGWQATGMVYLSPMAIYKTAVADGQAASAWNPDLIDQQATGRNYAYVAALCRKYGFRQNLQAHLFSNIE
jgi:7-carboxy-7-deazaguanine synthase